MIYDGSKDQDTTNIYNAVIKVIETRLPSVNAIKDDGVTRDVLFCLVNGRYITLRGIYRSMLDKHCWILCTVTLAASGLGNGITELSQAAFTKDQWSDLSTRFCELAKSGNVLIKNYKHANEFADMILSKGL